MKLKVGGKIDMKPCPFCGGKVSVEIMDEYGRFLGNSDNVQVCGFVGVSFVYYHPISKSPDCIIARDYTDPEGLTLFETEEDCIKAWNKRRRKHAKSKPVCRTHKL